MADDIQKSTDKLCPMPVQYSTSVVYTNELGKRKAAVMSLRSMKRTRSTSLASLPQEVTKNIGVYKISGSPKIKGYRPKQR